ncbi:BQ5605_C019g08906 [Microbotryum silenes-dioicae]|uniref:BQ5605_C019g08900 protein n=1 Tax=Microbotryum silenes-dioicae TaxID=796604 RepID=A0A2X0M020_9BASI|nr:BQ5605_C019g08900 [Microbotryum silenes-dioicae]SGY23148.1 BQ5605_C019g08906 [Microbotryum silenes-dioicae]
MSDCHLICVCACGICVVKEIEEAAMLAIHGRASDGTQRPIDHAKWVFQLRAPDGCFTRHLFDIRIRLQALNEPTPFTLSRPAPNQHRRPWIWIWWAYFCHPPQKWDHAVRKTTKLLPARWVRYFEAWALVTTLNPPELSKSQNLEQWATHVLFFPAGHGIQISVNPTLFRGPDVFIFPPIFPKGHQKVFDLPEQRWNAWWKALRKVRRVHSDAEDTGHLLSLGSLHPGSQVASPTSPHPNNRSASCVMCLSEAPECLAHLAIGCPFARRPWSALSPTPHPVFVDFVCPVVSRSERRLVELRVLFSHSIWKLCRRRRFSSDPLEPITEAEFEGLRASIQESKGRLVSLPTLLASASGAGGAFFPRGCLLLVAFSSLALHCGPDFSASCTLTYRKALLPRSHLFCDSDSHRTTIGMHTDTPSTETSERGTHVSVLRATNYMDWRRRLIGRLVSRPLDVAAKAVLQAFRS